MLTIQISGTFAARSRGTLIASSVAYVESETSINRRQSDAVGLRSSSGAPGILRSGCGSAKLLCAQADHSGGALRISNSWGDVRAGPRR
jgi:hypothetical protein